MTSIDSYMGFMGGVLFSTLIVSIYYELRIHFGKIIEQRVQQELKKHGGQK